MLLRDHMRATLAGWEQDLSPEWRSFFGGATPDFAAFHDQFIFAEDHPVIPPRKSMPLPGAPAGGHIFRVFDGVKPGDVRVLVIGQDPYPKIARATGRAFEDGAFKGWIGQVAASLKSLIQSAAALRLGEPALGANAAGWPLVKDRIASGALDLESVHDYFDRLQQQNGVLFVNAGWTLTRFVSGGSDEQRAHIALWKPLMTQLLRGLAARPDKAIVFLLLGKFAQDLFDSAGVRPAAEASGRWDVAVRRVDHPHPNAETYFAHPNPLERVNTGLSAMHAQAVQW